MYLPVRRLMLKQSKAITNENSTIDNRFTMDNMLNFTETLIGWTFSAYKHSLKHAIRNVQLTPIEVNMYV